MSAQTIYRVDFDHDHKEAMVRLTQPLCTADTTLEYWNTAEDIIKTRLWQNAGDFSVQCAIRLAYELLTSMPSLRCLAFSDVAFRGLAKINLWFPQQYDMRPDYTVRKVDEAMAKVYGSDFLKTNPKITQSWPNALEGSQA